MIIIIICVMVQPARAVQTQLRMRTAVRQHVMNNTNPDDNSAGS